MKCIIRMILIIGIMFSVLNVAGIIEQIDFIDTANAGTGKMDFVETDIQLFNDGKAVVEYVVKWNVLSGEFHGFYLGGFDRLIPVFDTENAWAIDDFDRKYRLDIKRVDSKKFDIVLAGGEGVKSGSLVYRFRFGAQMDEAGYLAKTTTDKGKELVVFHWAPTE